MVLSADSLDVLSAKGFLKADNGIKRGEMAETLKPEMISSHKIAKVTADALGKYGATTDAMCKFLLGDDAADNPELMALVSHVTSTSIQGALQKSLSNGVPGYLLGSGRVTRISTIEQDDGSTIKRNVSLQVKFVANSKAVIQQMLLEPLLAKKEKGGERDALWLAMVGQRQPQLAGFINETLLPGLQTSYGRGLGIELDAGDDEE